MTTFIFVFLLSYLWHGMGTTIGYHRLLSHRSFRCPKLVEYFWVLGGYLTFEGSPIWWATIHRAHHRFTDLPMDPHSPRYGAQNAYFGWLFKRGYENNLDPALQAKDLIKDPLYRFLDQGSDWHRAHWLAASIGVGFRLLLLLCFGWVTALASLLAGLVVLQVPLALNVLCHKPKLGYKNYATEDDSVNVWWLSLLTCGESWHNNHHAYPGSARTGLRAHEFDLSWLTIQLMKLLGLARNINEAKPWSTIDAPAVATVAAFKAPSVARRRHSVVPGAVHMISRQVTQLRPSRELRLVSVCRASFVQAGKD